MKKTFSIFLNLFLFLIVLSCGKISPKGDFETKQIDLEEFNSINLEGKFRAFYVRSDKNFVEIESYKNIINNLKIKVSDKTLSITEKRETANMDMYNVTIYSKYSPASISISDSVELNISSEIKTDNFKLNLKKNAKFIGSINSRNAEVEMQDMSLANFKGFTKDVSLKMKDTANLIATYWILDNLNIDAKNGVYAEVNVKDSLKGNIKNTAKFLYYNDPILTFKIDKTATVNNKILK